MMASQSDALELQIIDNTAKTDNGRYELGDNSQNKKRSSCSIVRLPYRHVYNSVFFDYDTNFDVDEVDSGTWGPIDAFIMIYQNDLTSKLSWEAQIDEAVKNEADEFWQQVKQKTQEMSIERSDAILEVYTDRIFKSRAKAILYVSKQDISEFFAEMFITRLLQREADKISTQRDIQRNTSLHGANKISHQRDKQGNTSLHYAAGKGWISVVKKLMEHFNTPEVFNKRGLTPLELAIEKDHNECATFLIKNTDPIRVRNLFKGYESTKCKLSFHTLVEKKNMQETTLAILDTMMEPLEKQPGAYIVYYHILDGDQNGRDPKCKGFKRSEPSCLHKIAESNNKEVIYHDVIRLLLKHKWDQFLRRGFLYQYIFYNIQAIVMTLALVLAAIKADPYNYDEGIDIFRGICEASTFLFILYNLISEVFQAKRNGWKYLKEVFNYLDNAAILVPLLIIPFRIAHSPVQWVFASIGYLCLALRGFEFAAVFKSTGAYVQILYLILRQDLVPFIAVFSLFLFGFTGALYFALRGEEIITTLVTFSNCSLGIDDENCTQTFTTVESTSLDKSPHLTEEYYHVLFSNLRVMIEGGSIFDEYFGPNGFKWLSVILYIIFLFLVVTVMLNLLIAQMSDTYANVQKDAHRSLLIDIAWIAAKVEHNSLLTAFIFDYRKDNYITCEVVDNLRNVLDKWGVAPISEESEQIKQLHDLIKEQDVVNEHSIELKKDALFKDVTTHQEQLISKVKNDIITHQKQLINEVRNEIYHLIEEKETANAKYRATMIEALNEQKQLIQKLIPKKMQETEL